MQQILIIQTAFLGDVILMTALAETLHHKYPDASIDILINKSASDLFTDHPYFRNVHTFDKNQNRWTEIRRLLQIIRKQKYDAVINIQRYFSTGILTAFSNAKIKSGFNKNPLSFLFTHRAKHDFKSVHETERNLRLIAFTGINKSLMPRLYIPENIKNVTSIYKTQPYICVAPASVWFTKQYPKEKWLEFINHLPDKVNIYLIGNQADNEICEFLVKGSHRDHVVNLSGRLSLLETASLMKDALMNFVNDSAPLHITSAVNAPVTAIFCSTIPEFGFGPLSTDALIVETLQDIKCRPCGIHGLHQCPEKHFLCALSIDNEILVQRVKNKLQQTVTL